MRFLLLVLQVFCAITASRAQVLISADVSNTSTASPGREAFIYKRPSFEVYQKQRKTFINDEEQRFLGANLRLTEDEKVVNDYIMKLKWDELSQGFNNSYNFVPARHFFEVLEKINSSKLFQFIRRLPKGAVLHAHDTAIGSTSLILEATYRENLWQKGNFGDANDPQFKFSDDTPGEGWRKVSEVRKEMTSDSYDKKIRQMFSLYTADPLNTYKCIGDIWNKFQSIFFALEPIVTFEPVWRKYYYDSLQQFYDDKVYYLEFRGVLPEVYDLRGHIFSPKEIVEMYINETETFKQTHPLFIGVKFIYAPIRFANDTIFKVYFKTASDLHTRFPNFVVGFDLVGQEDTGRPLIDFVPELLDMPESIQFFFHAGETNWYGMRTDQNLVDAILLGTKRIGHGYALLKHPNLLKELKYRQICVEINPISNQVLKLVQDYRNHPAVLFFSDNYPVVVSSDDPSFWRATPLSHDFYIAFLGIASAHHDLRLLKKLALNSIEFSAMNQTEKREANHKWKHSWHKAIRELALEIKTNKIQLA